MPRWNPVEHENAAARQSSLTEIAARVAHVHLLLAALAKVTEKPKDYVEEIVLAEDNLDRSKRHHRRASAHRSHIHFSTD